MVVTVLLLLLPLTSGTCSFGHLVDSARSDSPQQEVCKDIIEKAEACSGYNIGAMNPLGEVLSDSTEYLWPVCGTYWAKRFLHQAGRQCEQYFKLSRAFYLKGDRSSALKQIEVTIKKSTEKAVCYQACMLRAQLTARASMPDDFIGKITALAKALQD
jgi:hypothetical protein